jgi:hypothetical protein
VGHIDCYETIVEHLTGAPKQRAKEQKTLYEVQDTELKKLAFKMLIEKFNKKYQFLNQRQKTLVSRFINENTSLTPFKNFIYKEIAGIKKSLIEISKKTNDSVLKIKLNEIAKLTSEISASNRIKDEHISSMIKYYELIDHLQKNQI